MITLTEKGESLQDRALCVPECIAREFHLTAEEESELYRVLYKIPN